jgi:hypothetical protein
VCGKNGGGYLEAVSCDGCGGEKAQARAKEAACGIAHYARLVQGVRAEGGQGKDTLSGLYSKGQPTGKEAS